MELVSDPRTPGWVFVFIALLFALNHVGLLNPIKQAISRFSESRQEDAATKRDRQDKYSDKILEIVDEQQKSLKLISREFQIDKVKWSQIVEILDDIDQHMVEQTDQTVELREEITALYLVMELLARKIDNETGDH